MNYSRLYRADDGAADAAGSPIVFTAATLGTKRDGLDLAGLPWALGNYRANPVVLYSHDYSGRPPIGRAEVTEDDGVLTASITFDQGDSFAQDIERKYREGYMSAVSIGWDDADDKGTPARVSGRKPAAHELLDISAVNVPGDPQALIARQAAAMRALVADLDAALETATVTGSEVNQDEAITTVIGTTETTETTPHTRIIPGSYEYRAEQISEALRSAKVVPGDVWVVSTLDDYVIVHTWNRDEPPAYYRVAYTEAGGKFSFEAPTKVNLIHTATVVDDAGRGTAKVQFRNFNTTTDNAPADDGELARETAARMVAVLDPASPDPDTDRKRKYNALRPRYERLGWTMPEFVPGAELRVMDPDVWRELFVSGELVRVGKEFSAANMTELGEVLTALETGTKRLRSLVNRVSGKGQAEAGAGGDGEGERTAETETDPIVAMLRELATSLNGSA